MIPNLIGFVSKNFSPITSWTREWQAAAKNVHSDFKSDHALEKYSKITFKFRQSVRWLEHIPCRKCLGIIISVLKHFCFMIRRNAFPKLKNFLLSIY